MQATIDAYRATKAKELYNAALSEPDDSAEWEAMAQPISKPCEPGMRHNFDAHFCLSLIPPNTCL